MEVPDSPIFRPQAGFFRRSDFPQGFVFGAATSAFQIEGALKEGNREPCIWDHYSDDKNLYLPYHEDSVGHFKRYQEDLGIVKKMGFDAYRFSIAWSRVMKNGREPNEEGIAFYDRILQVLHENGIQPFVTIFHFDTPQALEDEYDGFLDRRIIEDFKNYAKLCFERFGGKVKKWITFNEPITFCMGGYLNYNMAPGPSGGDDNSQQTITEKKSINHDDDDEIANYYQTIASSLQAHEIGGFLPFKRIVFQAKPRSANIIKRRIVQHKALMNSKSFRGVDYQRTSHQRDPSKDLYTVAHHIILSHGQAVKLYREKYQKQQGGEIGITHVTYWCVPYSDLPKDREAAQRAQDFMLGWFLDPITKGEYPYCMQERVGEGRLPDFSEEESNMLKGSYDFIGLNYYTSRFVSDDPYSDGGNYTKDPHATLHVSRQGVPIGETHGLEGFNIYAKGLMDMLIYVDIKYNSPPVYVTENGFGELDDGSLSTWDALCDHKRISFYHEHLSYVNIAAQLGANVKGYFAWSLLDNFEWSFGYTIRFGLNYVDYKNDSKRILKLSGRWFKRLLNN